MSEKTLRMSIYFLIGVTVLYLLTSLLGRGGGASAAGDPGLAAVFDAVDPDGLTRASIVGPRDTLQLEKSGDAWTVNGFKADSAAIARFVRALDEVTVGSVTSTNSANHDRLGVSPDSAWVLQVGAGQEVLLGKTGSQFRTSYARLPDRDEVALIRGDLRSAAARPLLDWRDKMVLQVDTAAVARIEILREGVTSVYERQDSTWTVDGEDGDATTVRNVLSELSGFRATGFAPDSAQVGADPDRRIVAFDDGGAELVSLSLVDGDGNLWALSSQSPYVFQVPSFRADRIAPAREND